MHEIVTLSGKGGTGKTTLTACFAALADGCVLADCDVDAPDLHLVTRPTIERRQDFVSGHEATVRQDECIQCMACLSVCRYGAVRISPSTNGAPHCVIDPFACEGCGVCVRLCAVDAIEFPEAVRGEWYVSGTAHGPMVHARLKAGAENSGKLVSLLRTEARAIAEREEKELVLIDGSPGIGCPVIASITGASAVVLITEPTQSGLHDLKRIAELAAHFRLQPLVCINKCDVNPDGVREIEDYCDGRGIELIGRIPYDEQVVRAQLEGVSVIELGDSPFARTATAMWDKIQEHIGAATAPQD